MVEGFSFYAVAEISTTSSCDRATKHSRHSARSSQPIGEDKYAVVHLLKESLYPLLHALPINSIHKPLIGIHSNKHSKVTHFICNYGRKA